MSLRPILFTSLTGHYCINILKKHIGLIAYTKQVLAEMGEINLSNGELYQSVLIGETSDKCIFILNYKLGILAQKNRNYENADD